MYYVLTYFAGSFRRYNIYAKVFQWFMTIYPIVTALTGFQFSNLLPYLLQVVPTMSGYYNMEALLRPIIGFRRTYTGRTSSC
ncbi:hypothetical protein DSO57_1016169 [Entomophthora muscae]|uniref:Uncharacterized protein n=1 Tax=Entomophthora muscae TaxID=34485 RepID=A0ACC2SU34_9FUNG|nr:hypothetical protein DSO57_1016169 [Entomophthora muscae]